MTQEWWSEFEAALRDACGDLADHLPQVRAFVGDMGAIALFKRFELAEVIIACGVASTDAFLTDADRMALGARGSDEAIVCAVHEAHAALVAREGDEHWRQHWPSDTRERILTQLQALIAAERS